MANDTQPKRHHTVPRLLLNRFAHDGKVTVVHRSDLSRQFTTSTTNALCEGHFYSVSTKDGRDASVEKLLADHVEDPGAWAIRRLVDERRSLSFRKLRNDLATLLAFQYVRGPVSRKIAVAFHLETAQQTMRVMTPECFKATGAGEGLTDEKVNEIVAFGRDTSKYSLHVSDEARVHLPQMLKVAVELVPYFIERVWHLLEFDGNVLITGDEPVALVGASCEPGERIGLANARTIVFPADPSHAFVMERADTSERPYNERSKGTAEMATIINRHVAFGCDRYIVKHPEAPLPELELPEKAELVRTVDGCVIQQRQLSVQTARRIRVRVSRRR